MESEFLFTLHFFVLVDFFGEVLTFIEKYYIIYIERKNRNFPERREYGREVRKNK